MGQACVRMSYRIGELYTAQVIGTTAVGPKNSRRCHPSLYVPLPVFPAFQSGRWPPDLKQTRKIPEYGETLPPIPAHPNNPERNLKQSENHILARLPWWLTRQREFGQQSEAETRPRPPSRPRRRRDRGTSRRFRESATRGYEETMKAVIYARVSTEDQRCDLQLEELRGFAGRMGWDSVEYVEVLTDLNFRFLSPSQNIDTGKDTPMGQLVLHLLAAFAQFESSLCRERVNAGLKSHRAAVVANRAKSKSGKNLAIGWPKRVLDRGKGEQVAGGRRELARDLKEPRRSVSTPSGRGRLSGSCRFGAAASPLVDRLTLPRKHSAVHNQSSEHSARGRTARLPVPAACEDRCPRWRPSRNRIESPPGRRRRPRTRCALPRSPIARAGTVVRRSGTP